MNKEKLIKIFEKHVPDTPMSEDETMCMMNLLLSKDQNFSCDLEEIDKESEIYKYFKLLIEAFQAQLFLSRLKNLTTLKISLGALIILMQHMESPASVVMYVFYLFYIVSENTLITIDKIGEIFPFGFFSTKQFNEIWNAQKVKIKDCKNYNCIGAPDNSIDYLETWK
jgi:hypothetical protein